MIWGLTAYTIFVFIFGFIVAFGILGTDKPREEREHKIWACVQTGDTMECQYTERGFTKKVFFEVKEIQK